MGFSLLRWRETGRAWSRGEPPPRGSVEYCGVPEVFQPPPRAVPPGVSGQAPGMSEPAPRFTSDPDSIWKISATALDAADRWVETLARSVDYARQVHGDKVLSEQDARDFTDFYKRWRKFSSRVTTWSLYDRALEKNKLAFERLLDESDVLRDRFARRGAALVPVPHVTELVLLLRRLPTRLTPREMASKLEQVAKWGQAMVDCSRTTGEWVQRIGLYANGALLLGPAGILLAHYLPTSWSGDRRGLEKAIDDARDAARYLKKSADASTSYGRGEPVYDEFVRRATKVYVEAAALYGIRETQVSAAAEAVDEGARQVDRGSSVLKLLALAGVAYLGAKWLEGRGRSPESSGEGSEGGDVILAGRGDQVVVEGDGEGGEVYDAGYEEDEDVT